MYAYRVSNFSGANLLRGSLFIIAGLIFVGACILDYLKTSQAILYNPQPQFEGVYLWTLFLVIISALLFVISIIGNNSPIKINSPFITFELQGLRWLIISPITVLWGVLGLSFASVLLFAINPRRFTILSNEDQIIEISSALLLFLACANLVLLYLDYPKTNSLNKLWLSGLLFLAFVFFVIGMEEVSWFQRSFGIETPAALAGNKQGEMNLHNFASNLSEIGYYFAGFVYLIAFPFVYEQMRSLSRVKAIAFFAPGLTTLFVSASFVTFNYNLWNNPTTQFAFFATLIILIFYTWRSFTEPATPSWIRYYLVTLCLVCFLAQFIFIWRGYTFSKGWEVTEYKEFFLPLGFYIYSLELVMREKGSINLKFIALNVGVGLSIMALRLLQFVHQ